METILLGIGSSLFTEAVTWLNKKLRNTVFKGNGAYILSILISIVLASISTVWEGNIQSVKDFVSSFGMIWATSQIFYNFILAKVAVKK